MTTNPTAVPVAIPQVGEFTPNTAGKDSLPPTNGSVALDPALEGFHKIAAERRSRLGEAPIEVPFGNETIRVYRSMPAGFAFDAAEAEVDPHAAKRMLRGAIVEADRARFDEIMLLPPDNPAGIDGTFLVGFLENLGKFYGGVPLDA